MSLIVHHITEDQFGDFSEVLLQHFPNAVIHQPKFGDLVKTTNTNHQDVRDFHIKFGLTIASEPCMLEKQPMQYRLDFIDEEYDELERAWYSGNMHQVADALVDLSYVIHGTAAMMGLPWQQLWNEVHRTNMAKELGEATDHKIGIVKPLGWTPPDFTPWLGVAK